MPFQIHSSEQCLILELDGDLTVRHAAELGKAISSSMQSNSRAVIHAKGIEDIDTSILQLLVSLRKTAASFELENASEAFLKSVDRCALRRELGTISKEDL